MARKLAVEESPQLLEKLRPHPRSLMICQQIKLLQHNEHFGLEVWVDKWPDVKTVLTRYNHTQCEVKYLHNVYTLFNIDESQLANFLNTDIVDWKSSIVFAALNVDLLPQLCTLAAEKGLVIKEGINAQLFSASAESLKICATDDVAVKSLTSELSTMIASQWKYTASLTETQDYIRALVENFPSVCLCGSSGEVLAYALMTSSGAMGMLHVQENHRRKGFGKMAMTELSRQLLAGGYMPFCFIDSDNFQSMDLVKKVGFNPSGHWVRWCRLVPKEAAEH